MSGATSQLKRIAGFGVLPALSVFSGLVLLPIISHYQGAAGWTALSLGQSTGNVVSVVAGLAWYLVGGDRIAQADQQQRRLIYALSLRTRLVILMPAVIVATAFLILIHPANLLATILFMLGIAGNALTAAWFYAGTGKPSALILCEGVPRVAGYLLAIPLVIIFKDSLVYAALTVVSQVVTYGLNYHVIFGKHVRVSILWSDTWSELREQLSGMFARLATSVASSGGPPILGVLNPLVLPLFTAMDGVAKAGMNATNFIPSAFISWIRGTQQREDQLKRARRATVGMIVASLVGIIMWQIVGAFLVGFLYANKLNITELVILLIGLTVFLKLIAYSIEILLLIPSGLSKYVFRIQLLVAIIGLVMFPILAPFGAQLVFSIYVLMPSLQILIYFIHLFRHRAFRPINL
jgi:O-antigen/teichoic acid export membrane protein